MKRKLALVRGVIRERLTSGLAWGVLSLTLCFVSATGAAAQGPAWTEWERSHAIVKKKDWLVIDPPGDSACYMKQSYPDAEKMEISLIRGGNLLVCGPFYQQGQGRAKLTYRFSPGGKAQTLERSEVSNCISLPKDLLPGFKSGYTFHLEVDLPNQNGGSLEQEFSLMGFTAAHQALRSVCQ